MVAICACHILEIFIQAGREPIADLKSPGAIALTGRFIEVCKIGLRTRKGGRALEGFPPKFSRPFFTAETRRSYAGQMKQNWIRIFAERGVGFLGLLSDFQYRSVIGQIGKRLGFFRPHIKLG